MTKDELRPCIVENKKAFFHRWAEISQIREAILRGQISGVIKATLGIVEFEDGSIKEVCPETIKFIDSKDLFDSNCFEYVGDENDN